MALRMAQITSSTREEKGWGPGEGVGLRLEGDWSQGYRRWSYVVAVTTALGAS